MVQVIGIDDESNESSRARELVDSELQHSRSTSEAAMDVKDIEILDTRKHDDAPPERYFVAVERGGEDTILDQGCKVMGKAIDKNEAER